METKSGGGQAVDWDGFARSAGGVVGDMFGGPSAASQHAASSDAHTSKDASGGFGLFSVLANPFRALGDLGHAFQQEGVGALNDLGGAMDRQDAQRDLASRFNVDIGDGIQPMGQGENDVSQDEFIAIAHQYSDIRRGNSQLKLDFAAPGADPGQTAGLENRAMADIADIMQTAVGRDMIGDLANGDRETRIGGEEVDGARGGGDYDEDKRRYYNYAKYSPGDNHFPGAGDYRSDATLFHELTHAYHSMMGDFAKGTVSDQGLTPPVAGDEGTEIYRSEYQSVGLAGYADDKYTENAYRDARGRMTSGNRTLGGTDQTMETRERYTHD